MTSPPVIDKPSCCCAFRTSNASSQPTVWQGHQFPLLRASSIRMFSIIEIILGFASIIVQLFALAFLRRDTVPYFAADLLLYGIWGGVSYIITGRLGILATRKRTRKLLRWTVVSGVISIASSSAALMFSVISLRGVGCLCLIWFIFEIILASICGASIINSIIVTALTSAGLRSQPIENDQPLPQASTVNDQLELTQQQQSTQVQIDEPPPPYDYDDKQSQETMPQPVLLDSSEVQLTKEVILK